jgi:TetR/AcrR family transcriptional regulator, mexCD-oprJ operon repressor
MPSRVPAEQPVSVPETRRADAERNVLRIQEAAIRLWAEEPNAGVADVAAAAGVGRATLYRHFPTRESLLEAIRTQGLIDGEAAIEACRIDEGSPTEALSRLLAAWLELGDRYRVVVANPSQPDNLAAREREDRLGGAIMTLIMRGQAEGEFSKDVPPVWGASAVGALLVAAIQGVGEGRIRREDAHPLLIRSAFGALRPA